jgi:hypothetical protein
VLPALGANGSVTIRNGSFIPSRVAVLPGEFVTWTAEPGYLSPMHNVHFDGEPNPLGPPSTTFSESRRFDTEGTYTYHCDVHPLTMKGTVYVNTTGTVPASSPTGSPTASPTSSPGSGGSGGGATPGGGGSTSDPPSPGSTAPVSSFRVRATVRARRVFITLTLGARGAVRVRGTLRRGTRRVRRVTLLARPGRHKVRLPGKALARGRYSLTLRAGELKRTVRFRVRR